MNSFQTPLYLLFLSNDKMECWCRPRIELIRVIPLIHQVQNRCHIWGEGKWKHNLGTVKMERLEGPLLSSSRKRASTFYQARPYMELAKCTSTDRGCILLTLMYALSYFYIKLIHYLLFDVRVMQIAARI